MKIIVTRHGRTPWNAEFRVQGCTDIALDEQGHAQAEALSERLSHMPIAAVYVSPLQRAHDTGAHVARAQGCPILNDDRLLERHFGDWEGQRLFDLAKAYPALWQSWVDTPGDCAVPNAENVCDVEARAMDCIRSIIAQYKEEDNILVVTHATPVKLILSHYLCIPSNSIHKMRTDNCSYSELRSKQGGMVVSTLNEILFLQERDLL